MFKLETDKHIVALNTGDRFDGIVVVKRKDAPQGAGVMCWHLAEGATEPEAIKRAHGILERLEGKQ